MLPAFLVIGTKRGGTTSLYHWITEHPQVAPCRTGKGTHYFDVNHGQSEAWFRSGFPTHRDPWRITGEASPYYMFHPLSMQWIRDMLPDVRLIAVLREPVARAWSHHQYETERGREHLDFEAAIDTEEARTAGEVARILANPNVVSHEHRYHSYLARSRYAEQITKVHQHFPVGQLLVLQSEALFAEPDRQMRRVWDYLELDAVPLDDVRALKRGPGRLIPPAVAARLHEYFVPWNERLYDLPGIDFRWDAGGGSP